MQQSQSSILLLMAHPSLERSAINQPMYHIATQIDQVTAVDLYAEYPRFNIDIDTEQQRLLAHDVVVFQFPFYWYSVPSLLKEWQDLVLEYGFAYGSEGNALRGKRFAVALTAGGKEEAYQGGGSNNFTVDELLRPLEQMANLTGMVYQKPLVLFGSRNASAQTHLDQHLNDWKAFLTHLQQEA